jgi:hypothetical protein
MLPAGPCFAHWSDNLRLTGDSGSSAPNDNNNGFGTDITCGASSADGTAVTLLPALAHDCEYLWLGICGTGVTGGAANNSLMDLLIDPAGGTSWTSIIDDLLVGHANGNSTYFTGSSSSMPLEYHFPLWLPAGASIGARIRMQNTGSPIALPTFTRVMAQVCGGNKNPASWWCGQKVETVGTMVPSSSTGQMHTSGAPVAVTGAANNGSGLIRLTVSSTTGFTTGDVHTVSSIAGTTEANGVWTITVIDSTHIDLVASTFSNTYTSGGLISKFSSWTNLGSATGARAGAAQWAVGGAATASEQGRAYDFQFGAGSTKIGPRVIKGTSTSEITASIFRGPIFCDIPAGTQLQIRGACNTSLNGAGTDLDCAAYLVQ